MLAGPVSRPWRKYLRFSVRGLIVLVMVIGVGLGLLVRSAHIQRDAVAAIVNARGLVYYDWQDLPGGELWAPSWLVDLIGVDFFGYVTSVYLVHSSTATDTVIAQLGRLTRLQNLNLDDTSVSNAGLVNLKGLTSLSDLSLSYTQVSDAGLAHLKGLTSLLNLRLARTQVSDAGLVHLKGLTNLSFLDLRDTHVTDAGLAHLKGLTNLSSLYLNGTQVTDAGMKATKQALPRLWISH